MDEERNNGNSRPKVQGQWQCADCGKQITELPFQPREGQDVRCSDCYKPRKSGGYGPRPKVQGQWQCADCGKEITELPFQPRGNNSIYCTDCWRKNRS